MKPLKSKVLAVGRANFQVLNKMPENLMKITLSSRVIIIWRFIMRTCLRFLSILNSISVHITDKAHAKLRLIAVAKIYSIYGRQIRILLEVLLYKIIVRVSFIGDHKTLTCMNHSQMITSLHSKLQNSSLARPVYHNLTQLESNLSNQFILLIMMSLWCQ
jgi:hypothetical protein